MQAREEIVEALCDGAIEGMINAIKSRMGDKVTSNEVISAYLTLALRTVGYAMKTGCDLEEIRAAVQRIYTELPPEVVN